MNSDTSIIEIKGIGETTEKYFAKLGVYTVGDILSFYPRTYFSCPDPIEFSEIISPYANLSESVAIRAAIKSPVLNRSFHGKQISVTTLFMKDADHGIEAVWYNMPYIRTQLRPGTEYVFFGKIIREGSRIKMQAPKAYMPERYKELQITLQPVYHLTRGLKNNTVISSIKQALVQMPIVDSYPQDLISSHGLTDLQTAYEAIHFPYDREHLKKARDRLVYNEFVEYMISARMNSTSVIREQNGFSFENEDLFDKVYANLPYQLTEGQKGALVDIIGDMKGEYVSERLIQGDVGSGKTIVAFLAMLLAASNGYQAAIMAPTEVLATQHYKAFSRFLSDNEMEDLGIELLTGSLKVKEKREARERIVSGKSKLIIGTHAIIQEGVEFDRLALVVTDEQHRFGVKQRDSIAKKGSHPHSILMSATPIPRTLAKILYGGMNISVIKEKPKNRLPIKTCVIKEPSRGTAYNFIRRELAATHQAIIICPLVSFSETTEAENVTEYREKIAPIFGEARIGLLHGKMKPAEKNAVMQDFYDKKTDILVSTTVVEVGIDVPNATVIMIENATRFGLASLHQLRGRVGRGDAQSYCILMDDSKGDKVNERLDIMNKSDDGFYLAESDLSMRGAGDLYGIRQSGDIDFCLADIIRDADIMQYASDDADRILSWLESDDENQRKTAEKFIAYAKKNRKNAYDNL